MRAFINGEYRDMSAEEVEQYERDKNAFEESLAYKNALIQSLKDELATFDYIGVKIATGVATKEEYAAQIEYAESLRVRIRELQGEC